MACICLGEAPRVPQQQEILLTLNLTDENLILMPMIYLIQRSPLVKPTKPHHLHPYQLTEFRQPLQVQSHLEMPRILVQLGHTQRT